MTYGRRCRVIAVQREWERDGPRGEEDEEDARRKFEVEPWHSILSLRARAIAEVWVLTHEWTCFQGQMPSASS